MISIPLPPRKSPEIDSKTRRKIITDALIRLRSKANSRVVELERTDDNQLTKLHRGEIIMELERIQDRDGHFFRIMRAGHTVKTAAKPASLSIGYSEPRHQWAQWKEIPDSRPIILALLDDFDNWCEAQIHKQNIGIKDLSEDSLRKVLNTTTDIYQQFELGSQPSVEIGWIEGDPRRNKEARRLALEFLDNKGFVRRHSFKSGLGRVEVEIAVKEFLNFRNELLAHCRDTSQKGVQSPIPARVPAPANAFQSMEGVRWEDIQVKFVDGHTVKITGKGIIETVDYKEMGFEDSRAHKPNTQWALLKILAENEGEISWDDSSAKGTVKKQKQLLSEGLQLYFGIDDDPFHPYKENRGYRIKLTLVPV